MQYWLLINYQPEHENASVHLHLQILENIKYNRVCWISWLNENSSVLNSHVFMSVQKLLKSQLVF